MIRKFEITGVHIKADDKLKAHITETVAKLEKYIPKHARESAHVDVKLRESKGQGSNKTSAEIILYLPHDVLTAKESGTNLYAGVDSIEAKLRNQLKKYKEKHGNPRLHRRLVSKLRQLHRKA